jgi:hypothetical protein
MCEDVRIESVQPVVSYMPVPPKTGRFLFPCADHQYFAIRSEESETEHSGLDSPCVHGHRQKYCNPTETHFNIGPTYNYRWVNITEAG